MNKNIILVFIVILVVAGSIVVIQQQQSTDEIDNMELKAISTSKQIEIDKAKQAAAIEAAKRAEAEAAKQKALEEARKIEEAARQKAAELQAKLSGLISQAQSLLDSGKFQEAIDLAKNILSQDANNTQAKSILEQATARLKALAQEKASSLVSPETQDSLKSIGDTLKAPGQ